MGPYIVVEVSQAAVALSGPVEFGHLGDAEAGHELSPDGGTQPVAQRHAHPVLPLRLLVWLVQQVAADLPNVLHNLGGMERKDSLGPLHQALGSVWGFFRAHRNGTTRSKPPKEAVVKPRSPTSSSSACPSLVNPLLQSVKPI